ncbi:MAG: alkaline phosphatase family protein [Polyangiaceae bacterium]
MIRPGNLRVRAHSILALGVLTIVACGSIDDFSERGGPRYATLEQAPTTTPAESKAARANHAIKTVFLILFENHDWSDIKGSSRAPYFNSLLSIGAHTENYFENASAIHPSEPNYIWLEAGDNLGVVNDDAPSLNHRSTTKHLTALLDDAAISWKSYQENIDGSTCPLYPDGLYDPKHDPSLYFDDVTDNLSPTSAKCIAHERPYPELEQDLNAGTVAAYNFITPNLCNNMHDDNDPRCASPDSLVNGDQWLSRELPKILASAAYLAGGAVFITWDESENGESPIGMIVLSPYAKKAYSNAVYYTHSSMLRTAQEIFAVQPYLRDAADSPSLSDLFETYP